MFSLQTNNNILINKKKLWMLKFSIFLLLSLLQESRKCSTVSRSLWRKQTTSINLILLVYRLPLPWGTAVHTTITYGLSTVSCSNRKDCGRTFLGLGRARECVCVRQGAGALPVWSRLEHVHSDVRKSRALAVLPEKRCFQLKAGVERISGEYWLELWLFSI